MGERNSFARKNVWMIAKIQPVPPSQHGTTRLRLDLGSPNGKYTAGAVVNAQSRWRAGGGRRWYDYFEDAQIESAGAGGWPLRTAFLSHERTSTVHNRYRLPVRGGDLSKTRTEQQT